MSCVQANAEDSSGITAVRGRGLFFSGGEISVVVGDGDGCAAFGDVAGIVNGLEGYGINSAVSVGVARRPEVYCAVRIYLNIICYDCGVDSDIFQEGGGIDVIQIFNQPMWEDFCYFFVQQQGDRRFDIVGEPRFRGIESGAYFGATRRGKLGDCDTL